MKYSLKFVLAIFLAMIFALSTSQPAHAQQATGRIIGNVSDPSGAGVPGVQVKATNVATQVSQETKTDREGFFEILSLPIGTYDVRQGQRLSSQNTTGVGRYSHRLLARRGSQ